MIPLIFNRLDKLQDQFEQHDNRNYLEDTSFIIGSDVGWPYVTMIYLSLYFSVKESNLMHIDVSKLSQFISKGKAVSQMSLRSFPFLRTA